MQNLINSPLTLEEVCANFSHWRANRVKREKTPSHLWNQVSDLIQRYPISKIISTLGISYNQIKSHVKENKSKVNNFIEAPLFFNASEQQQKINFQEKIIITRPDGTKLQLVDLDQNQIDTLLSRFIGA